jgi:signal transduction histidine kinase
MRLGFFENLSLQKKFILITVIAIIVLMVILGVSVTRWQKKIMYRDIERQGKILAETLAVPVRSVLLKNLLYERLGRFEQGGAIYNYIAEIFEKKDIDITYMIVLDENGKVIAHNDVNEYGKVYTDSVTTNALAVDDTVIQMVHDIHSGYEILDVATPLSLGKKRWGTLKFAISLEKIDNEIKATVISVLIYSFILLVGGLIIIVVLSRSFIRPITQLAKTMERAGGDVLDVRVDIKGRDEVAFLGHSFNEMIDRIREANMERELTHEKLLQFARTIEKTGGDELNVKVEVQGNDEIALVSQSFNRLIDRIRDANYERKLAYDKLLQSEKIASIGILAAGVAHEINSPLGGMFNCVEMLEQKGEDSEFRNRYLKLMKDGLSRIETTVRKLLWMSRKEDKSPQLVDIKQSLQDVHKFMEYSMKKNNIEYRENVEDGTLLLIDPHDLEQVLINLMNNAIQSMTGSGIMGIYACQKNSLVILEVSDTGEGIYEESIDKLFDPFYTTKPPGEGTGLGLWLTYEIVKNYNGDISVKSSKGKGSTFTITFNRE